MCLYETKETTGHCWEQGSKWYSSILIIERAIEKSLFRWWGNSGYSFLLGQDPVENQLPRLRPIVPFSPSVRSKIRCSTRDCSTTSLACPMVLANQFNACVTLQLDNPGNKTARGLLKCSEIKKRTGIDLILTLAAEKRHEALRISTRSFVPVSHAESCDTFLRTVDLHTGLKTLTTQTILAYQQSPF